MFMLTFNLFNIWIERVRLLNSSVELIDILRDRDRQTQRQTETDRQTDRKRQIEYIVTKSCKLSVYNSH